MNIDETTTFKIHSIFFYICFEYYNFFFLPHRSIASVPSDGKRSNTICILYRFWYIGWIDNGCIKFGLKMGHIPDASHIQIGQTHLGDVHKSIYVQAILNSTIFLCNDDCCWCGFIQNIRTQR